MSRAQLHCGILIASAFARLRNLNKRVATCDDAGISRFRLRASFLPALFIVLAMAGRANICSAQAAPDRPPSTTSSAKPSLSDKYAAYDAAFQQTLLNPADPKVLTAFAAISVEIGDIEGAISALERLLLINGDLPDVRLELGVLYFRLGAFAAADMYLRSAIASPNAMPQVKARADRFLKAKRKS